MIIYNQDVWIKAGYEAFALSGMNGLKIEQLSKKVGISKSSFYHHFADLEIFIDLLLKYHIKQSEIIGKKESLAQNIDPDLINILIDHRIDLLFNRQLRIHQNNRSYAEALQQSNTIIGNAFILLWMKDLNLSLTQKQINSLFSLALENFFLQINNDNMNYTWLSKYFANLKSIANNFT